MEVAEEIEVEDEKGEVEVEEEDKEGKVDE